MMGRRIAAWLCVLLVHALAVISLLHLTRPEPRRFADDSFVSEPITLFLDTIEEPIVEPVKPPVQTPRSVSRAPVAKATEPAVGESAAITPSATPPARVD